MLNRSEIDTILSRVQKRDKRGSVLTEPTRANATLVAHGPDRWGRHPFYVTAALLMASATLVTANWLSLVA